MNRSHCCYVRLSNRYPAKSRDFICYHYVVAGAICAASWVYAALGDYRYSWITKGFNIILYVIPPGTPSIMLVFLWSYPGVRRHRILYMDVIWLLALETGMSKVIAAQPAVMRAQVGSICAVFFSCNHQSGTGWGGIRDRHCSLGWTWGFVGWWEFGHERGDVWWWGWSLSCGHWRLRHWAVRWS